MTTEPAWHCLIGTWCGHGTGSYPDAPPFRYVEETVIAMATGWGMLHVLQKTWLDMGDGARGKALHLETGLIVPGADGSIVYSCAQDSGRIEAMRATPGCAPGQRGVQLDWATTAHGNDDRLVRMGRSWSVDGDVFIYRAYLSTARTPEYRQHLEARLALSPRRGAI